MASVDFNEWIEFRMLMVFDWLKRALKILGERAKFNENVTWKKNCNGIKI